MPDFEKMDKEIILLLDAEHKKDEPNYTHNFEKMKKISLKNLNLNEVEQLSREQLKNVLGGEVETTGGCCVHTEDWTQSQCDYGRDQA